MLTLFDSLFFGMIQFSSAGFERSLIEVNAEAVVKSVKRVVMWFFGEIHKAKKFRRDIWRLMIARDFRRLEQEYQDNLTEMGVAY